MRIEIKFDLGGGGKGRSPGAFVIFIFFVKGPNCLSSRQLTQEVVGTKKKLVGSKRQSPNQGSGTNPNYAIVWMNSYE